MLATEPTSINWPCVAVAETGRDVTMHGSTYSTEYGVVNDIVYQYASPEVQARVFAGTATEAEQTDIVARFAADHGTGGWGTLTKQKCGL
jgi:starvation-inducible outer membrane lipoprotein